jgi:hypothetical protein
MFLSVLLLGCATETPVDESSQALCPIGQSCCTCPSLPHEVSTCSGGACDWSCVAGYEDCDGNLSNGCEINLATNNNNCGSCGHVCPSGSTCQNYACVVTSCPSGQKLCGNTCIPSTGCCTNTDCGVTNGSAICYQNLCYYHCSTGAPLCQ